MVQGTSNTQTAVSSSSFTDSGLTVSITPSAATSNILILVSQACYIARSANNASAGMQLLRGATQIYDAAGSGTTALYLEVGNSTNNYLIWNFALNYLDSPNTTSSTTYKTQVKKGNADSITCQYQGANSTIIALEIGA